MARPFVVSLLVVAAIAQLANIERVVVAAEPARVSDSTTTPALFSAFEENAIGRSAGFDRAVHAGAFATLNQTVSGRDVRRPVLVLLVYNYAAISADAMSQTRENVSRIYRGIDIEIEWFDLLNASRGTVSSTPIPLQTCASHIVIRLIGVSGGPRTPEPVLGAAVAAENGGMLSVFYSPVLRVALRSRQTLADILGLVIAHEIGHLLLPAPAHSNLGIMRAEWDGDDIRRGVVGALRFTSSQVALMQSRTPGGCMPLAAK